MRASSLHLAVDLIPDGILLAGILALVALAMQRGAVRPRLVQILTLLTLAVAGLSQLLYLSGMPDAGYRAYSDGLVVDRYTVFLVPVLCLLGILCTAGATAMLPRIASHVAEFHALLLVAVLGGALLVGAREMVALWVALELLSVSLAALVGIVKTDRLGSEAAVKQMVVGGAGSALLLYGLAILYGVSGSTVLTEVALGVSRVTAASSLGLALVVGALLLKLGVVPFHQWVPDTARGAAPAVGALVLAVGSTAVTGALARLAITTFGAASGNWTALVALTAALTMVYTGVAALGQRSLRRICGLLAAGQVALVLVGVVSYSGTAKGVAAMLVALATGALTVTALFVVIAMLDPAVGDDIDELRGLSRRSPLAATMLALGMLSLLGVPPLVGFLAKVFVLEAAVIAGYAWLVLLAVITTVVAAVPVLRLVKLMFVDLPDEDAVALRPAAASVRLLVGVCALAVALLGAVAEPLFTLASGAAGSVH